MIHIMPMQWKTSGQNRRDALEDGALGLRLHSIGQGQTLPAWVASLHTDPSIVY